MSSVDGEAAHGAVDEPEAELRVSVRCRACRAVYNLLAPTSRRCRFCGARGTKALVDLPVDADVEQLPRSHRAS